MDIRSLHCTLEYRSGKIIDAGTVWRSSKTFRCCSVDYCHKIYHELPW